MILGDRLQYFVFPLLVIGIIGVVEPHQSPYQWCYATWIGDNICDDQCNKKMFGFDGGDCCDNSNDGWDQYCENCYCLEGCLRGYRRYVGDGFCDDENNKEDCGWDGGDCCGNEMYGWNTYCSDCQCIIPSVGPPPSPSTFPPASSSTSPSTSTLGKGNPTSSTSPSTLGKGNPSSSPSPSTLNPSSSPSPSTLGIGKR